MITPPSIVPNGYSGVILGQRCFMDYMDFRQVPRSILDGRGEKLKEDEWGDIKIIEWMNSVNGGTKTFPQVGSHGY
jgi:hypothetical protein